MDTNGRPTVISTFAGTGGSSLGYHWAGFKELLAIDFDDHAVECFKLNFPDVPVWHKSVIDVTGEEILKFCKLKKGELDVFDGSPPCQGFSTAGQRRVKDSRNDLFQHYCRLVEELEPKVFVMENVTGMAKGTMKGKFIEIIKRLKSMNYEVKCKQMNAMYYEVPQARQRLIFIGVRKDLKREPVFPVPSKTTISVQHAFKGIENRTFLEPNPKYRTAMDKLLPGQNLSITKEFDGKMFSYGRSRLNEPSQTILKSCMYGRISIWHPTESRNISIEEAKRLCSFPDEFKLSGSYQEQWARLGNAVMPKFMQAIAETIKTEILEIPIGKANAKGNGKSKSKAAA